MPEQPPSLQVFKYQSPGLDGRKAVVPLARTDRLFAYMQRIAWGGETPLHAHNHLDGFWFVLNGRLRFYSDHDTIFAEVGKHEGVLIPRGAKYWFEQVGDEPVEVLQIECSDRSYEDLAEERATRTYYNKAEAAP